MPFIVIDELGLTEGAVGLFFAAALAGGIVVFVALRRVRPARMAEMPLPMLAYIALGTVFGVLALSTHPAVLIASALLVGAAAGLVYLFVVTWIQRMCSERHHGRLFALLEAGSSLAAPTSYVVAGALLELSRRPGFSPTPGASVWRSSGALGRDDPASASRRLVGVVRSEAPHQLGYDRSEVRVQFDRRQPVGARRTLVDDRYDLTGLGGVVGKAKARIDGQ